MRALGLDVGERRIGVAVSDPSQCIARPLTTLARRSRREDFDRIAALVAEHEAGIVVVGRPLSLDGTEGPQARRVGRFAQALAACLPVPVVMHDERYSTIAAVEIIRDQPGPSRRGAKVNARVDAVAAAVILQSYLDSQKEATTK